jgi:hypothetical protein
LGKACLSPKFDVEIEANSSRGTGFLVIGKSAGRWQHLAKRRQALPAHLLRSQGGGAWRGLEFNLASAGSPTYLSRSSRVVKPGQRWLTAAAAGTYGCGQAWPTAAHPGQLTDIHTDYQQVYIQGHRPDHDVLVQTYTYSYDKVERIIPIKMLRAR